MNGKMNNKQILSKFSLAVAAGVLGMGSALAGSPVGELEALGGVQIAQEGAGNAVRVADTTYGWFSGDAIDTGSSQAMLRLENGASLGFGTGTAASVSVEDGAVVTSLKSGVLLYALEDRQVELRVESGDYRFSTRSDAVEPIQVSSGPRGVAGMIKVLDSGQVQVSVHEGVMVTTDVSGSLKYQVASGETVAFEGTEPRQVNTQIGAVQSDDDDDEAVRLNEDSLKGLTIVVTSLGFGIQQAVTSERREDPEPGPVSP